MSGKPKKKSKGRLGKGRIAAAIVAAVVCLIFAALAVTNAFVPVVYLSAYMVAAQPGERGVLTVTFLDVGYGDCTLCELPDGKIASFVLLAAGAAAYVAAAVLLLALRAGLADAAEDPRFALAAGQKFFRALVVLSTIVGTIIMVI